MQWYQTSTILPSAQLKAMVRDASHLDDDWDRSLHAWRRRDRLRPDALDALMIWQVLVAIHSHALAVTAKLAVGRGRDWARRVSTNSRALLEGKELLGTERLVMDLSGGLDEILEVGTSEEVTEVHKLAVALILN
jgi:hypothetical protein